MLVIATDIYYFVRKYLHSTEQAKQVMGKLYSLMERLAATRGECVDALRFYYFNERSCPVKEKGNMDLPVKSTFLFF